MKELLTQHANRTAREIDPGDLRKILTMLIGEADYVMAVSMDKNETAGLVSWLFDYLIDRYHWLPLHHIREAIRLGALGQRSGTSKLIPRNLAIWIAEQDKIHQEQLSIKLNRDDASRRKAEEKAGPRDHLVATAVRMKVGWLADGMISSAQYDSFSASAIHKLLTQGVPEKDIRPVHVVPNYKK